MSAAEETPIATQARDWHVRQLAGLTPAEAGALRDWLEASAAHAEAFAQVGALWSDLGWDETLNAQALDRAAARERRASSISSRTSGGALSWRTWCWRSVSSWA